ncbi:MAG: hypothetical protein KatS3mg127_0402 [Silanimonas sp.]|nr:MAG: hypothetical protein KatS3mg127_0402 [Silanimonas sp.]
MAQASGGGCTSSSSSSGRPMLPASAVRSPAARSRKATRAVTVLLPLVPVTQTVCAPAFSENQIAVPLAKRTPLSSASIFGEA